LLEIAWNLTAVCPAIYMYVGSLVISHEVLGDFQAGSIVQPEASTDQLMSSKILEKMWLTTITYDAIPVLSCADLFLTGQGNSLLRLSVSGRYSSESEKCAMRHMSSSSSLVSICRERSSI